MSEINEFDWHIDIQQNAWEVQVHDFSKELSDFLSDDKLTNKEQVWNVLKTNLDLKFKFEDFLKIATPRQKLKCKKDLQLRKTEDEIKSIILENIPEWYKIWNNDKIETSKPENVLVEESEFVDKNNNANIGTKQAETDTKQAQVDKNQAQVDINKAQVDINNESRLEAMNKAIEVRDQLVNKYKSEYPNHDLDTLTNENSKKFQETKTKLESNWVINQLKNQLNDQITEDDEDKKNETINKFINDYILLQTTLTELKSNPTIYDKNDISFFDKIVKDLDNACNIPDTNLNSFSSENITRTRHELFNSDIWNQDLIDSKKSNLKSRDYTDLFPDKSEKELINEYGKFLDNEQIKSLIIKYNNNENLTDEERNYLITGCKNAKNQIDNKTKDMVEELCLISQIKWMYMCMWEWADFQMNKSNEIESENWVLTLNGHIDWIDFSIRQDTNDPEARLQTSTRLRKRNNAFEIWDNFEDSNFILPSQSEVFNLAVKSVNSDWALQEAESPADYVSKLQDKIMSKMDDMYEDTKYVNHYMHEQVKWEQIMDKSLALVKNLKKSEIPTPITESNKGLFDFVGLIHFNIKNSTSLEKDRMNSCLEKIQNLVNEYKDTEKQPEPWKYPPIIEHYLTDKAILKNTKTMLEWWVVEGESMFDLFGKYIDKSDQRSDWKFWMINLAFLENDLIPRKEGRSLIAENYAEINLKKEWGYADMYLDNQLMWISETPAFA